MVSIEELRKFVGKMDEPYFMEVEKGAIKRYAEAIGDTNPIYHDEEYARRSKHGTMICPPGFFGWPVKERPHVSGVRKELLEAIMEAGYRRPLDGGPAFEFYLPVRAGDTLAASEKVVDVYERMGNAGKLVFAVTEITYINQNGDRVANVRSTVICV